MGISEKYLVYIAVLGFVCLDGEGCTIVFMLITSRQHSMIG